MGRRSHNSRTWPLDTVASTSLVSLSSTRRDVRMQQDGRAQKHRTRPVLAAHHKLTAGGQQTSDQYFAHNTVCMTWQVPKGDIPVLMNNFFLYISFYCTASLITDYKYTYVTINGLYEMHPLILLLLSSITSDWVWLLIFTRFLNHTQRRTTVGRTPLDEWSVRRRDLYLTTHNNHKPPCPPTCWGFLFTLKNPTASAGFEPANLGYQRPAHYL